MVDGGAIDFLQTNADVLRWLERNNTDVDTAAHFRGHALVDAARSLREIVRVLVAKRKAGSHADVKAFNAFLAKTASHPHLVWTGARRPEIVRLRAEKAPEQSLAPVAEAAAELLVDGDFNLVRKCEDNGCILWFYDRTKSHRRRWCSMAACGNRHKVKAFRQRQQDDTEARVPAVIATAITAKAQAIQDAERARNELAKTQAEAAKTVPKRRVRPEPPSPARTVKPRRTGSARPL